MQDLTNKNVVFLSNLFDLFYIIHTFDTKKAYLKLASESVKPTEDVLLKIAPSPLPQSEEVARYICCKHCVWK